MPQVLKYLNPMFWTQSYSTSTKYQHNGTFIMRFWLIIVPNQMRQNGSLAIIIAGFSFAVFSLYKALFLILHFHSLPGGVSDSHPIGPWNPWIHASVECLERETVWFCPTIDFVYLNSIYYACIVNKTKARYLCRTFGQFLIKVHTYVLVKEVQVK